eukprot:GHVT01040772.1.p1 GENE.GHVT01040772.1~~GHVT01040772.1.p1  ORF type:complete len:345 (+),score=96.49 GHVT01040772.1:23-1036(+)
MSDLCPSAPSTVALGPCAPPLRSPPRALAAPGNDNTCDSSQNGRANSNSQLGNADCPSSKFTNCYSASNHKTNQNSCYSSSPRSSSADSAPFSLSSPSSSVSSSSSSSSSRPACKVSSDSSSVLTNVGRPRRYFPRFLRPRATTASTAGSAPTTAAVIAGNATAGSAAAAAAIVGNAPAGSAPTTAAATARSATAGSAAAAAATTPAATTGSAGSSLRLSNCLASVYQAVAVPIGRLTGAILQRVFLRSARRQGGNCKREPGWPAGSLKDRFVEHLRFLFGEFANFVFDHSWAFILFPFLICAALGSGFVVRNDMTDGESQYALPNSKAQQVIFNSY